MSKVLWVGDAPGGNYTAILHKKLRNLYPPDGNPPLGVVLNAHFKHDPECGIFHELPCDCQPTLFLDEGEPQ